MAWEIYQLILHEYADSTIERENNMSKSEFIVDLETIRNNARQHLEKGAVTENYASDREAVIKMLNGALATELVCVLRYKQHYFMCAGRNVQAVAAEFLEHAAPEQEHADQLAERITQLGGEPEMDPAKLTGRSHSEYTSAGSITGMISENLVAERIAIDSYKAMINFVSKDDPTTRRLLEEILAVEEEHADDLANLLATAA
jgi:bacterioferritin